MNTIQIMTTSMNGNLEPNVVKFQYANISTIGRLENFMIHKPYHKFRFCFELLDDLKIPDNSILV